MECGAKSATTRRWLRFTVREHSTRRTAVTRPTREQYFVIGMECNRRDAIAAVALMAIQGQPDTFEDAANTRNRARGHGTRLAPTPDALARRKRCEPHGLNPAGAPEIPRGSPWRHAAADGGRRATSPISLSRNATWRDSMVCSNRKAGASWPRYGDRRLAVPRRRPQPRRSTLLLRGTRDTCRGSALTAARCRKR